MKFLHLLIFLFTILFTSYGSEIIFKTSDFGAIPNDNISDEKALQRMFDSCKNKENVTVIFDSGNYQLKPIKKKDFFFSISNVTNLIIECNGSLILGDSLFTLFKINDCHQITIRNLFVDWKTIPFAGGKVIKKGLDFFDLHVFPPHQVLNKSKVEGFLFYDTAKMHCDTNLFDHYQLGWNKKLSQKLSDSTMRVFLDNKKQLPDSSKIILLRYQIYGYNAFHFENCSDLKLEGISVYTIPGFALYANQCRNISLSNFKTMIKPQSGRWMSTTADATHFINCRGSINIKQCLFEGMGDDAINIHTMYMKVDSIVNKNTIVLKKGKKDRDGFIPVKGDKIEFSASDNKLVPIYNFVVDSFYKLTDGRIAITFKYKVGDWLKKGDIAGNASITPFVNIDSCVIINNRARGILIQTRNVTISNCIFKNCSGAAIQLTSDVNYWWEGIGVKNVTISKNEFINCNFGIGRRNGVIDIFAETEKGHANSGVHNDIKIVNNTFENNFSFAIHVGSSKNVLFTNNKINNQSKGVAIVRNSDFSSIKENDLKNTNPLIINNKVDKLE